MFQLYINQQVVKQYLRSKGCSAGFWNKENISELV